MEYLPREVKKENRRLALALGMNPHDEPLYKWIWANTWLHLMRDISGHEPKAQESGLIVMCPIYIARTMIPNISDPKSPHRDRWAIGHWHTCGPEAFWRVNFGSDVMWSNKGFYTPTDIFSQQGQTPDSKVTDDLIVRVKQFRAMTLADTREHFAAQATQIEKDKSNLRKDMIGDALTAFGNIPGSRSGSVSFPSTSAQLQQGEL